MDEVTSLASLEVSKLQLKSSCCVYINRRYGFFRSNITLFV
jgi:hypothetical protein